VLPRHEVYGKLRLLLPQLSGPSNVYQLSCCLGGRCICLGKRTGEACRGAAKLPPERRFLDGRRPDAREARCPFRADSRLQLPQGTPLPLPWYGRRAVPCTVEPCPTIATEHRAHCPYSPGLQERPSRSQCVRGESTSPIPLGAGLLRAGHMHAHILVMRDPHQLHAASTYDPRPARPPTPSPPPPPASPPSPPSLPPGLPNDQPRSRSDQCPTMRVAHVATRCGCTVLPPRSR
jgi:hypothetical protein